MMGYMKYTPTAMLPFFSGLTFLVIHRNFQAIMVTNSCSYEMVEEAKLYVLSLPFQQETHP